MTQVLTLDLNPGTCVALVEHEPEIPEIQEEPQIDISEMISKVTEELFNTTWEIFNTESPRKFLRVLRIHHSVIDFLRDFFYLCGVLCAWFIADFVLHIEPEPKVLEFKPIPLLVNSESELDGERCSEESGGAGDTLQVKRLGDVGSDEDQGYETSEDMPPAVELSKVSSKEDGAEPPPELSQDADRETERIVARGVVEEDSETTENPGAVSHDGSWEELKSGRVEEDILEETRIEKKRSDSEVDDDEGPPEAMLDSEAVAIP